MESVNWSELLSMFGLFSGVVGVIQWVVVRVLIEPMIHAQTEILKEWSSKQFVSLAEFHLHEKTDLANHGRNEREIDQLQERLNRS